MNNKELDARHLAEQLKKLPEDVQEKIGYMIQGAALVSGNHAQKWSTEANQPSGPRVGLLQPPIQN